MVCGKCGNTIPEDSDFCPFCGNKIENVQTTKDVEEAIIGEDKAVTEEKTPEAIDETTGDKKEETKAKKKGSQSKILIGVCIVLALLSGYLIYEVKREAEQIAITNEQLATCQATISEQMSIIEEQNVTIQQLQSDKSDLLSKNVSLKSENSSLQNKVSEKEKSIKTNQQAATAYNRIVNFAKEISIGYASSTFYTKNPVVVLKKSDSRKTITLVSKIQSAHQVTTTYDGISATFEWVENNFETEAHIYVTPSNVGVSTITVTNNKNSDKYGIIVIVTE